MSTVTPPAASRRLGASALLAVVTVGSWAGALRAQEAPVPDDTAGAQEERITRADSMRAAMVRPQASPDPGLSELLGGILGIVVTPVELVGRGVVVGAETVLPVVRTVETELGVRHMSFEIAKIGPQSGPAGNLRLGRPVGPYLDLAYSVNASQRYGAGVRLAGPSTEFAAGYRFERHAQAVFWGVGPESRKTDAADYRWNRHLPEVAGSLSLGERATLRGNVGYERNRVSGGGDPGLPDVPDAFDPSTAPGIGGETEFLRLEVGLSLDGTRWRLIQRKGLGASVNGALFLGVDGSAADFHRLLAEGHGVLPVTSRHALASRLVVETNRTLSGGSIPFTHLASLGSVHGLRSYPRDRFRDRDRIGLMSEYRYEIWRDREISTGVEGILFFDVGAVERSLADLTSGDLRSSYGFGLRVLRSADLEALTYAAFGSEGSRVDLRFDWPF